ncbi:hypothetical protein BDY24DRAFT_376505 [Mrakia frigida]|uniref:uncharacterized protein n=1 Tax=Mrakia frigida TaxID=29902 RepID=UPI003FCC2617
MSSLFPLLNPLLSDLVDLPPCALAPASPSSTSVSDGSGPEDFDDAIFAETSFQGRGGGRAEWRGGGQWKAKEREGRGEEVSVGVGGDKLPYEIWICIIKLLSSTSDLKSCLLVSHSWCQIGVEILWHKPIFQRVNTLYRLLNVIDPIPVQDETIGAHKARMLLLEGNGSGERSSTNSPLGGGGGGNSSMGESSLNEGSSQQLQQQQQSLSTSTLPRSGSRSSTTNNRSLPWDYPTFLIDDPSTLLSSSSSPSSLPPPLRTFPYATFIRRLNLGNISESMSDHSFFRLRTCSRLERLTLQGCSKLSDAVLAAVLGDGNMPELVALDLTNVKLVTDRTVGSLARGCPRLQGLNLSGCRLVTDEGVVSVAEGCRLLRRIKLVKCDLITDASIVALARSCPLLLEVDLVDVPQITSIASRELWLYSSHLRELRLSSCSLLTDTGFPFLFPTATQSHPVTTLALPPPPTSSSTNSSNSSTPYHTPLHSNAPSPEPTLHRSSNNFNASSASKILHPPPNWMRQFDHLRILDLTSCSQLTDQAVEAIVSNAPKIRSLVLAKCTGLTDESLASICRFGRSLHQLHMGHVARITDGAVARLARTCTRLRYIDLACESTLLFFVTNLTDNAIHALVERPSSLERIHLSYCENISIDAVHYLLQRLGKLTHLSLTGVPAFRRPDLQKFCRQPPKVRRVVSLTFAFPFLFVCLI